MVHLNCEEKLIYFPNQICKNQNQNDVFYMSIPGHWPNELSVRYWSRKPGFHPRSIQMVHLNCEEKLIYFQNQICKNQNQNYVFYMSIPGHWPHELSVRQWSRKPGFHLRSSHTKDSKMVLDAALLNT